MHAGGDLKLVSMEGYGVDAYLMIQHLEGVWQALLGEAERREDRDGESGAMLAAPQASHG